ncbi:MAG TPA: DUF5610 domain-containing protein [bacterium]|nr:DUF5610 domain-containing protein [bacterium]
MGVNQITPSLQSRLNQPDKPSKTATKTDRPQTREIEDVVSWRDKNFAFKLYSQTTINRLNAAIDQAYGELGVEVGAFEPTPEGTATFITDFVIGMYSVFRKQNPDLSETELVDKYEKVIGRAIDKGFNEALKVLQGLNINDEKTMSGIRQTYDLVQEKLNNFYSAKRAEAQAAAAVTA